MTGLRWVVPGAVVPGAVVSGAPVLGVLVLGVLGLGAAAVAQSRHFDPAPTEECLTRAERPVDRAACIGRAAGACAEGATTEGLRDCLQYESETFWKRRLNDAYGALMQIETAKDEALREHGIRAPSMAGALWGLQRQWGTYRNAVCHYERAQWGGAEEGGTAWSRCMLRLTGERALELEARLAAVSTQ